MNSVLSASKVAVVGGLLSVAAACSSEKIVGFAGAGHTDRPFEVAGGSRFYVDLRGLSAGMYQDPPAISSPAVEFLNVELPEKGTPPPGGPLQRFHFRTTRAGIATITFTTERGFSVIDSIVVR